MASSLHTLHHHYHLHLRRSTSSKPHAHQPRFFSRRSPTVGKQKTTFLNTPREYDGKNSSSSSSRRDGTVTTDSFCCLCKAGLEIDKVTSDDDDGEASERPPFDINLAVILAGFAFEAYSTPPVNVGRREVDAADCKTVYLSESFVREIYDGQLSVKLRKGVDLPAMDPWGTSDPYVIMELDGQVAKSKIKWGTKEPTWNEDFNFNIKQPPTKNLQVAAWDANLVAPHKRMGNAGISLECFCDGNLHEVLVELEGMGGGGKLLLEVKYETFEEIEEGKNWWMKVPIVSEFLRNKGFEPVLKKFVASDTVQARQFAEYAFGQLKSFNNNAYIWKNLISSDDQSERKGPGISDISAVVSGVPSQVEGVAEGSLDNADYNEVSDLEEANGDGGGMENGNAPQPVKKLDDELQSDKNFWKNFANEINQNVVEKFGFPIPEKLKWDGFDLLDRVGLQSQKIAEATYVESGLATPEVSDAANDKTTGSLPINIMHSSFPDIKEATRDLLKQTDSVLGVLMVLTATVSQAKKDENAVGESAAKDEDPGTEKLVNSRGAEEMKALFSTAETAMEAWAMLATSLGHPSFIKSEFEKLCFLDNETTDTQVAIWRDSARKRLVIAFRGTEQARWKDLRTDLMLAPAGIGGDFKQEVQVHSGFLSAYDSVRIRIISLIKLATGYIDDLAEPLQRWHVYVTGHSLGGALATLLALELASSQLAKRGVITISMYNFGSPRVGNKRFADIYNERVKDSWRVVNHRDIIPTVPRLMGYCHVAQPVYLATGDLTNALENMELSGDGYQADMIGESTPDVLVSEFMKGEKELIQKILQTEINIFRSIRDGTALMQHMEDFYYITLLENVRSNYQPVAKSFLSDEQNNKTIS
ncbi:uncharacterized protein LOC126790166 isoform X2 [Argentina anserina]|uniref:uncharacterized protein LOC126790166 isoform X2 n=1 Tax=Argentina anserina TaxID=57926 RepID=UPI00217664B2|nr:uncharacterized protein LOC126790166 isoform X2 [Potentilla anserina]